MNAKFATLNLGVAVLGGMALLGASSVGAEKFSGGELKKGATSVSVSGTGVVESISLDGVKIIKSNGGLSTSGSKSDEWQPWAPQSWAKDVVMTKEETPDSTVVNVKGVIRPKGQEGQSVFSVVTKIYDGKIVQESRISTPDKELWRRAGGSFKLDADIWGVPFCYRNEGGEWKMAPEVRGNRNLSWPKTVASLDFASKKYTASVKFDGVKTCFFDDRKPESPLFNLEFGEPPQEMGADGFGLSFKTELQFALNKTGELPVKPPAAAPPQQPASFDLNEKSRMIEDGPFRKRLSLDGDWDLMPLGTENSFPMELFKYPVPAGKWSKAKVPVVNYPTNGWSGPEHAAWYRIQFTTPQTSQGSRVFLHFEEASYGTVVFLNGKELSRRFGGFIPLDFDVTDIIKPGQPNTLEVFTADFAAALDKKAYPDGAPKVPRDKLLKPDSVFGLIFASHKGIQQSVSLDLVPAARLSDVFVKTSVRKWTIDAEVEVSNSSKDAKGLKVRASVLDGDKLVKELPAKELSAPASGVATATLSAEWKDPKLWGVKQPNLYTLRTELLDGGKVVDTRDSRFGFREFWIDKANLYLNGVKIKLRECATHIYYHPGRLDEKWDKRYVGKPYEGAKAEMEAIQWANFNCSRMVHRPHPAFFYDLADELGHLVFSHFPIAFYKDQFKFSDPLLKANAEATIAGLVRKERNHPSIIMWEAENEGFPYGEHKLADQFAKFYGESVGDVCKRLDPTRPVKYGRDGDIFGKAEIYDLHGGDSPDLADLPLPNSNWQVPGIDRPYSAYGVIGGTKWRWPKDKPIYFGEGLYWMLETDKSQAARFLGEKVFDDTKMAHPVDYQWVRGQEQYLVYGELEYFKIGIPVWRMYGEISGYCPWGIVPGMGVTLSMRDQPVIMGARELMKPERFFPKQLYRNFNAGSEASLDFCLLNDDQAPHKYDFSWQLKQGDKVLAEKSVKVDVAPAETSWQKVSFATPKVEGRADLSLDVRMARDGAATHEESYPLRVYSKAAVSVPPSLSVVLYDPAGRTSEALRKMGVKHELAKTMEEALMKNPGMIVIGEDAFDEGTPVPLAMDEYVKRGGRVLILSQRVPKNYAPLTRADQERAFTREIVFICDPSHPLAKGISQEELSFWNHPDWNLAHSVAYKTRQKFGRGNVHPVLECGDLWFSPLQEGAYGKGLYVECSMDIVRKLDGEPLAAKVWANVLDRLANYKAPDWQTLSVLRDPEMVKRLQGQGIVCVETSGVPEKGVLMLTNSSKPSADELASIKRFAESGNTVWLHCRKDGGSVSAAQSLTGARFDVKPCPSDNFSRYVRRTEAGKQAGQPLAGICSVAIYDKGSVDDIWTASGSGSVSELATSGAVFLCPLGKGRVVVERLAWDKPANLMHQQWADHFLNAFVTNLASEIDIFRYTQRKVYMPGDFFQVDMRSVMNRGFRDDTADDGKGGWTDQGPDNDLRGMKSGLQTYHQIVFDIVDPAKNNGNACLVLHADQHAEGCPKSTAEIPVGKKAKALFLLHTAAWYSPDKLKGKPVIKYVVTYEDGSSETVQTLGGDDIKDWWTPGNCEKSLGVSLLLKSEAEADAMPRRRGLVLQEWANPHPEKAIKSIRIESGETGAIPIVMGISGLK